MSAANHLCGLLLGQPDEPAPDLVVAVALAMHDAELLALADQLAEKSVELIRLAGSQQILQHAVATGVQTAEPPAAVLQLALDKMAIGIEIAKIELDRSARRLAAHRCSPQ